MAISKKQQARDRIGARLRAVRRVKDITQKEVSKKTGISEQTLSKIESGRWSVGFDLLEKYANALGMQVDIV